MTDCMSVRAQISAWPRNEGLPASRETQADFGLLTLHTVRSVRDACVRALFQALGVPYSRLACRVISDRSAEYLHTARECRSCGHRRAPPLQICVTAGLIDERLSRSEVGIEHEVGDRKLAG